MSKRARIIWLAILALFVCGLAAVVPALNYYASWRASKTLSMHHRFEQALSIVPPVDDEWSYQSTERFGHECAFWSMDCNPPSAQNIYTLRLRSRACDAVLRVSEYFVRDGFKIIAHDDLPECVSHLVGKHLCVTVRYSEYSEVLIVADSEFVSDQRCTGRA